MAVAGGASMRNSRRGEKGRKKSLRLAGRKDDQRPPAEKRGEEQQPPKELTREAQSSPSTAKKRNTLVPSRPMVFAMAVDFLLILGRNVISLASAKFSRSALAAAAASAWPAPAADRPEPCTGSS